VTVNGVAKAETTDYTIDYNTGEITFLVAPASSAAIVIGRGEFHVPVRFDIDQLDITQDAFDSKSWQNIPLVEIRPRVDPVVVEPTLPDDGDGGGIIPPDPYDFVGVHFDGATSAFIASAVAPDTPTGAWSMWFRYKQSDQIVSHPTWWLGDPDFFDYGTDSNSNQTLRPFLQNGRDGQFSTAFANSGNYGDGHWHHVLLAWNGLVDDLCQCALAVDGVVVDAETNTGDGVFSPRFTGLPFYISAFPDYEDFPVMDWADFWFSTNADIMEGGTLTPGTIAKFYDVQTGRAVNIGANGELPTGSPPWIFLHVGSGDTADDFLINRGTDVDFTYAQGALTLAGSSPIDEYVPLP
jgi:hypothetical protein